MITKNLGLFLNILEHYQFSNENLSKIMEGVIEWLLFNAYSRIFSAITWSWGPLDFYSFSSLKQQSADRHVATLRHIIKIPCQPVFAFSL